jgi:hypothetical protein
MANDVAVAHARSEVDQAIENYMRLLYGPLVTVDWIVLADNVVDADGEDTHVLHPAYSQNMSSWKAAGIGLTGLRYFASGITN